LTGPLGPAIILNVFKTRTAKGGETRDRIFDAALTLFREHGFDATTMRAVAAVADQSLGAAYHYFRSKESIVLAYYDHVQDEHAVRVADILHRTPKLRDRIAGVMHSKLDILSDDRRLLGALLRYTGDPSHPLSFLGRGTRDLQRRSMTLFRDALQGERLPTDLMALTPTLLWAMHMGLLLYFLYDDSPRQRQTRALTDGATDFFVRALTLGKLPVMRPFRRGISSLLEQAGLLGLDLPTADAPTIAREES